MKSFLPLFLLTFLVSTKVLAITLGTYNIRNFDYDQRYRIHTNKTELTKIISQMRVDVLAVEEINNTAEFERYVQSNLPGFDSELTRCGGAHGQRLGFVFNTQKVELLSFHEDLSITNPGGEEQCDAGSRPLAIALFRIKSTGQKFYAMAVHLKSGGQSESMQKRLMQFELIKGVIRMLKERTDTKEFFLAGDMNTTNFITRGDDYKVLQKLKSETGMIDLAEKLPCSAYWWGGTDDGIETPSLLDHMLVTPGLLKRPVDRAQVGGHCAQVSCREVRTADLGVSYESVSDHCPLSATVQ